MFSHAESLGLSQTVITNSIIAGAQFSKFEHMLSSFAKIQVSMNGVESTYEKSVGARTWNKFLEAVSKIVKVNENVWLSFVVTPETIEEISKAVNYASKLKVRGIRFGIIAPLGRAGVQDFQYFNILPRAEENILCAMEASGSDLEFEVHFNPELGHVDQFESDAELRNRGEGQNVVFINHEGGIYPFPLLELDELHVGNILRDNFAELWRESPILNDLRNFDRLTSDFKACKTPCGLSSRSMTYLWTGSIESKLPCHRWGYLKLIYEVIG
jgi:MoaA/NifB/PqqE/SkfB family radical SAM enzyme